jgi:hypothetical protein
MANEDTAGVVRAIFTEIPNRLSPAAAKGVDALIRFNLTGNASGAGRAGCLKSKTPTPYTAQRSRFFGCSPTQAT